MRIGIDGTAILLPAGDGTYARELMRNFAARHPEHEFVLLTPKHLDWLDGANVKQRIYPEVNGIAARLKYVFTVARILREENLDVFHNLWNYGLYFAPCPMVTTVHDLGTLFFPGMRSKRIQYYLYKYYLPSVLRRSRAVVVDSSSARNDLAVQYGLKDVVHTIPLGYDRTLFKPTVDGDEQVLQKYGLKAGFLLFVGQITPKKNLQVLVRALDILRKQDIRPRLVIAGRRGYRCDPLFELIETLDLKGQVTELGFVPDDDLPALYRQAKLYLFPSLYEGFGLPVVESMACNTPALISDAGSLPELIENPDQECPADDPERWAERIALFLTDQERYDKAVRACQGRANLFSWETCVDELIKVYESVVKP